MFVPYLVLAIAALVLFQLGALSVWAAILELVIRATYLLVVGGVLYVALLVLWRFLRRR